MRVVIASGIFPPDIGGPATYARALAGYLSTQGDSVTVITYADPGAPRIQPSGYRLLTVSRRLPTPLAYALYTYRLFVLAVNSDCIYAQGPLAGGFPSFVVSLLTRRPYLLKVTGDYAWEQGVARFGVECSIDDFQSKRSLPFFVRLLQSLQSVVTRRAVTVVVPSEYLKSLVAGWGVDAGRITVIRNASYAVDHEQDQRSVPAAPPLVVSIGRLVPWKGFAVLIKAWSVVRDQVPGAELEIIGDGPEKNALELERSRSPASDSIRLLGRLPRVETLDRLRRASAFVLNSGYEGHSHVVLEAQALGVPCAVSQVGGNPEVVEHAESGLLFAYNDVEAVAGAIIRLLKNPAQAGIMARTARERNRQFSEPSMLNDTRLLLKRYAV